LSVEALRARPAPATLLFAGLALPLALAFVWALLLRYFAALLVHAMGLAYLLLCAPAAAAAPAAARARAVVRAQGRSLALGSMRSSGGAIHSGTVLRRRTIGTARRGGGAQSRRRTPGAVAQRSRHTYCESVFRH